jgi:hypothetical protein
MLPEDEFENIKPEDIEQTNLRVTAFCRIELLTLKEIDDLNRLMGDLKKEPDSNRGIKRRYHGSCIRR